MGRMQRTLTSAIYISSLLAAVVLWPIPLLATTYSVKSGGGGNYSTIQQCATAMTPGDTCMVFAGTYNENVTVTAGTAGNYKTLTVNPGDTVYVLSFSIDSYTKVNGFQIQNTSSPTSHACVKTTTTATNFYITNNHMTACAGNGGAIDEQSPTGRTDYGSIQGNTLVWCGTTPALHSISRSMTISGDHHLIENNDISHCASSFLFGHYIVFRKNTYHDTNQAFDCGSSCPGSSNGHMDMMQVDPNVAGGSVPSQFIMGEGNTQINQVGTDIKFALMQAEACNNQCQNAILRYNVNAHTGSGGIVDDNSFTTTTQAWINVVSYNNDWIDTNNIGYGLGSATNNFSHGSFGWSQINELFYYPFSLSQFNPYQCGDTACSPAYYGHNLAFCTITPCQIYSHLYGSGNFTDDPGNIVADPLFVNYAANDFHLRAGSPALNGGTNLTSANGSGTNSTTLVVNNANFFQDGWTVPGVQPDCLRIGASTTVCIAAGGINYSTKVITLASPVSWNASDPIYIYRISDGTTVLTGTKPDLGAFPSACGSTSSGSPAPPSCLAATIQ